MFLNLSIEVPFAKASRIEPRRLLELRSRYTRFLIWNNQWGIVELKPLWERSMTEAIYIYILYTHPTVFATVHIPVVFVSGHILEDEEDCADY